MEEKLVHISVTTTEFSLIINSLSTMPFNQVVVLINKLTTEADKQLKQIKDETD